jgi:DNA-binding PucR family transcriptional regulator
VTKAGIGSISVIVQQMTAIRDDFIPEVFDTMQAEIRGLNHDARMLDLWKASITENFDAGIEYLDRGLWDHLPDAPAAALDYARAAAQRDVPLSALVRAHRIGQARFLEVAMGFVSLLEPAQRVPTITELVNRANHFIDLVADQLTIAYELEHDRWVSRRGGLEQRWVSDVLAGGPIDVKRAEKVLRYRFDGVHVAGVLLVDASVASRDVVALFDQVRSLLAVQLGAAARSLMVPTDDREARLWFTVRTPPKERAQLRSRVRTAFESAGHIWPAVVRRTGCRASGHR